MGGWGDERTWVSFCTATGSELLLKVSSLSTEQWEVSSLLSLRAVSGREELREHGSSTSGFQGSVSAVAPVLSGWWYIEELDWLVLVAWLSDEEPAVLSTQSCDSIWFLEADWSDLVMWSVLEGELLDTCVFCMFSMSIATCSAVAPFPVVATDSDKI